MAMRSWNGTTVKRIAMGVVVGVLVQGAILATEIACPNPMVAIFDGEPGKGEADAGIRIVGTLGGSFSGQAVVYGAPPADVKMSDLKTVDGKGVIPAASVVVRYAHPTNSQRGRKGARFDALMPVPRQDGATHPVWVTVHVPADAVPGEYEGRLSVDGSAIPVRLKLMGWSLPKAMEFRTFLGIYQSPESVALQYGVELWSERHFELIGKSFEQLARVGNKVIVIPVIAQTNFGNSESMVRWIRDGAGFKHDFSIVEKYLDLYIERVGKPTVVIYYIYEPRMGGVGGRAKEDNERGVHVTLFDPAAKTVETFEGPSLSLATDAYPNQPADMRNFWKPVLDGLHERLARRKIGDEAIMLGINGDDTPGGGTIANLKELAPYARWTKQGHGYAGKMYDMEIGYITHVWGAKNPPDPVTKRVAGWKNTRIACIFPRFGAHVSPPLWDDAPLPIFHVLAESCITTDGGGGRGIRGAGRIGADFWPVLKDGRGRGAPIIARYPHSNWSQLNLGTAASRLLAPGQDGALSTVRFELLLGGIQEAEARIFIESALLDKKLPEAMAKRLQEILDERVLKLREAYLVGDARRKNRWDWFANESGWQERAEKLFAAAAEAERGND
jgi:hypothetical protein